MSEIFIKSSRVRAVLGFISSNYLAHPIISNIANSINDNQVKNKQWLVSIHTTDVTQEQREKRSQEKCAAVA